MQLEIPIKKWEQYKSKLEISMTQTEIHEVMEILMLYQDFSIKRSDIDDFLIKCEYSKKVCKLIHTLRKIIRKDNVINTLCRNNN